MTDRDFRWATDEEKARRGITVFEYDDVKALNETLVGRTVTKIEETKLSGDDAPWDGTYDGIVIFTLDDGRTLKAYEQHGGCACSNGCWDLSIDAEAKDKIVGAVITRVDVKEFDTNYTQDPDTKQWTTQVADEREPGSVSDGAAIIKIYLYTALETPITMLTSEGGDNGYYGWGFSFVLHNATTQDAA